VDLGGVGSGLGPARVWLVDLRSGQANLLFGDSQMLGYAPRWSPDGKRLGYVDPQAGVRVVDLDSTALQTFPSQSGSMGTWSPDGQRIVLEDMAFEGERYQSFLVRAELTDGSMHQIGGKETQVDDGSPNWSPAGDWIAFGRKALADGTPTAGQQLWLMRPDGAEAHALATDPEAHFGSFAWSPDSRQIVYLRFPLMTADAYPSIWLVSLDGGESFKIVEKGTLPGWLP
jgi:Tol biopolymer transport system component